MFSTKLNQIIETKDSLLCVGLDSDPAKIPKFLCKEKNSLLTFNREIIEATAEFAAAFKLNIAFYESLGVKGWKLLKQTLAHLPPDLLTIADAKRADIGNSARKYAETFFKTFSFDAVTVAPYMGYDSVAPFLEYEDRGVFVLCLTSNPGAQDFQYLPVEGEPLYLHVTRKVNDWNSQHGNCGLVVGATRGEEVSRIRQAAPELPFLIPGVGAQGGDLQNAVLNGTDRSGTSALINASRSIIYASAEKDFAESAARAARRLKEEFNTYRDRKRNQVSTELC